MSQVYFMIHHVSPLKKLHIKVIRLVTVFYNFNITCCIKINFRLIAFFIFLIQEVYYNAARKK